MTSPAPLLSLTDEELAVLAGPDQGVVAMPHLEALDPAERDVATCTAYRSMLASGLLVATAAPATPWTADERLSTLEVELPAPLDALLRLREAATVLLCVQRDTAQERLVRYVHVLADETLVEDVLEGGLHRFGLLHRTELAASLQAFLVPDDAPDGVGEAIRVGGSGAGGVAAGLAAEAIEVTGDCLVSADAAVRYDGDDGPGTLLGLFIGPHGTWLTRNDFGAGGDVVLEPAGAASVGRLVEELVCEAQARVARSAAGGAARGST